MVTVSTYHRGELDLERATRIAVLLKVVWPDADKSVEEFARMFSTNAQDGKNGVFYGVWNDDAAIAFAWTFPRCIRFERGELEVMALAGVCVDPAYRGQGLGALIVRKAFGEVDGGRYKVSLFQTGVPDFYRGLGAITVQNQFWDGTGSDPEKSPWWDKHVMIYPGNAEWPAGRIDLNGAGY